MPFGRSFFESWVRPPSDPGTIVITPAGKSAAFAVTELLASRELVFFLAWRDLKVRYSQTFLGVAWILLQPIISLVLFAVIFGRFAGLPSDGLPYPAFIISGLIIWTFFINGALNASTSVVNNADLVSKTYFARLAIPSAIILSNLVDLLVSFVLMLVILAWYGVEPSWRILLLVPLTLIAFVAACGAGFFLAAVNVVYRDVKHIVPFLAQAWFFASPVVYPLSLFPGPVHWLLALNPMTGVLEGFHWAAGAATDPWQAIAISTVSAFLMLTVGVLTFCRMESRFADVI
ncbi:ABC transporter permease [Rhizobium sp. TH2]|uniref:ABC transporter permease n=1 Tax=Rhizobium sp. TH2 TaxID=2775403 RepID=UPI002157AD88|nr:ABC transporter permease [Rhizobium sp. TH2]UVC11646.1 ABC transporter permease [Rhizobium sp. TH2]